MRVVTIVKHTRTTRIKVTVLIHKARCFYHRCLQSVIGTGSQYYSRDGGQGASKQQQQRFIGVDEECRCHGSAQRGTLGVEAAAWRQCRRCSPHRRRHLQPTIKAKPRDCHRLRRCSTNVSMIQLSGMIFRGTQSQSCNTRTLER